MTTYTGVYRIRQRPPAWLWLILLAVLAIPPLVMSAHASLHAEADTIRRCAANPDNLAQVWLNSSGDRLNCLIRLNDGKVGNYVIQYSCKTLTWFEVTAYMIGDGSLAESIRVLRAKACRQVYP